MFNAVFKIPMQFFILGLGVLAFVFYQFETPPVLFNEAAWNYQVNHGSGDRLRTLQNDFNAAHARERDSLRAWFAAERHGDAAAAQAARATAMDAYARGETARAQTRDVVRAGNPRVGNDADYMFITFIVHHLPHGIIGLLVAAFFAAALSSKAGELNALGATTTVDFYRHVVRRDATDAHYVAAVESVHGGVGLRGHRVRARRATG